MESNKPDTPESLSAPIVDDHLSYPAAAASASSSTTAADAYYYNAQDLQPLQSSSERLIQSDKLYVGNLPPEISIVDIHKAFKKFGQISDIQIPYNTGPGGRPKGYAFVLFNNRDDAARAQVKMDGVILSKRIIKVDFAHLEKLNAVPRNRKPPKDAAQVTTLSMLKGSQHKRSTREQIALAEAKLRELSRPDHQGSSKSPALFHPSLPSKPSPAGFPPSSLSTTPKPKSTLPSLPLVASSKPAIANLSPIPKTSSTPISSGSHSTSTKKTPKLTGIKIIKKTKDSKLDGELTPESHM